jgi:hypothetical protein
VTIQLLGWFLLVDAVAAVAAALAFFDSVLRYVGVLLLARTPIVACFEGNRPRLAAPDRRPVEWRTIFAACC